MKILVSGSSGLIGSEVVLYFDTCGYQTYGFDNNMRAEFFGSGGDTTWNLERLRSSTKQFVHHSVDIRDRRLVLDFFASHRMDAVIHCAAQPSHDLAKDRVFDDFDVNAVGTLNLLEATRMYAPEAPFVFLSTNKVYGDAPNEIPLVELDKRWDYKHTEDYLGVSESCRIDQSKHSLFGASKVAADILTQEYGRYFDLKTVCFRCGCLTGPRHSGVELHGFLSYLVKVAVSDDVYTIFGYKGKQVRDQLHSVDVVSAIEQFIQSPRVGAVYNLGGGRQNSISILESLDRLEALLGKTVRYEYSEQHRAGDHICYISDLTRFKADYPEWSVVRSVDHILEEMVLFEGRT